MTYGVEVDEALKAALIASSKEYLSPCNLSEEKKTHLFLL